MDTIFSNLGIKFWSKSSFKISPGPNFTPHHQLQGSTEWWKTCRKVTCSFFFLRIKITWKQQYTVRCRFQVLASSCFIRLSIPDPSIPNLNQRKKSTMHSSKYGHQITARESFKYNCIYQKAYSLTHPEHPAA